MTYKMTTPPAGPTGDVQADLLRIFRWIREFSREHEIDKRNIRDALQEPSSKASYTITNDTTDRTLDANSTDVDELADFVSTLARDVAALNAIEVN